MPPVGGIPLDCLDLTLDVPSKSSRRASIFDHLLGIPNSVARDRLSNPFGGLACDLSRLSRVRLFARWARLFRWVTFDTVSAWNSERPICEGERTVRRHIYRGSYLIYRIYPLLDCGL